MLNQAKSRILIVDDRPENVDVLSSLLGNEFEVRFALSGEKALKIAREALPDLILLDIMMPVMDGYAVCEALKEDPLTADIPVIFVTALDQAQNQARGLDLGAADYITKPLSQSIVLSRVRTQLALRNNARLLEQQVRERTAELAATQQELIQIVNRAVGQTTDAANSNAARSSRLVRIICRSMALDSATVEIYALAAPLRDIGKLGIPQHIWHKPGPLEPKDWEVVKQHPEIGAAIIGEHSSALLEIARIMALTHHEKWNGQGYPRGLCGEEIPLPGRIVSVADVFDALLSKRPYRDNWEFDAAVDLVRAGNGEHFDPRVVTAFLQVLPQIQSEQAD